MKSYMSKTKYFVALLLCVVVGMLFYELICCNEFIGYIDGYYTYKYLPDFFIEKNYDYYVKFPIGTAICESPFFFAAHAYTLLTDPASAVGFGGAYEYAIGFAGIFYFVIGFSFLYTTLKKIYDGSVAFATCLLLMLGTPIIYYGTKYASFSHIYTFAVTAIFLYLSVIIDEGDRETVISFIMGLLAGLLFLIRNINIVFVASYVLLYFGMRGDFLNHLKKVFSYRRLPADIAGGVIAIMPQLLHWHRVLGSWLPNTYSDESFTYYAAPKLYQVWFSDAKGYFIFAPVMIFSVIGFFFMIKTGGKKYLAGSVAMFAFESYLTAAWWCWWMGGVYSIRSFLDITVFMALPMAAFFSWVLSRASESRGLFLFFVIVTAIFIYVNFALMRGAERGIINETMSNWWQLRQSLLLR